MWAWINRQVVLPAIAWKRGSSHFQYLRELEKSQFLSAPEIAERQLRFLQTQLRHAEKTVPYYRQQWQKLGLSATSVRTLADLKQFPILRKADLRSHEQHFRSEAFLKKKHRVKKTSGSTGIPLSLRLDEQGAQWKTACTLRADQWSGYRLGERVAKVWGNPEYRHFGWKGRLTNWLVDRALYLDTINVTEEKILAFAKQLLRHQPGLIFGHAHSLYLLAVTLRKQRIHGIAPHGIISTAMPLHLWQRKVIEEVFGTAVTNRYGCEETSIIASQCEQHQGLHVAAESVYIEVEGDGSILVTDLTNQAMPLIRYRVGDKTSGWGSCDCGRGLPVLADVMGRDADFVLTPSGSLISGISLTENFALHIEGAAQVQIVQQSVTSLRIRLVRDDHFSPRSEQQIQDLMQTLFGGRMKYDLEYVTMIPQEPSGKFRFCISQVAQEYVESLTQ